jgi:hypothetical protein
MLRDKQNAIIAYKSTITVFKKWLADRIISMADLIEDIIAKKYGLSSCSLWRELT